MPHKTWSVQLENPYDISDIDCPHCLEHLEFAQRHNMLILVDQDGHAQGVTFNHVMGRDIKDIKIGDKDELSEM
jgi:hypothetical protein